MKPPLRNYRLRHLIANNKKWRKAVTWKHLIQCVHVLLLLQLLLYVSMSENDWTEFITNVAKKTNGILLL